MWKRAINISEVLHQDPTNDFRSFSVNCAFRQPQKLTKWMPAGGPDAGSFASYLAHKDQRFPEFCLANGTDVACLTALLAGSTNSIGLLEVGKNASVKGLKIIWFVAKCIPNPVLHSQIPCTTQDGHQCYGEGWFGHQQKNRGCLELWVLCFVFPSSWLHLLVPPLVEQW